MKLFKRLFACMFAALLLGLAAACTTDDVIPEPDPPQPAAVYELAFPQEEYRLAAAQSGGTMSVSAVLTKDGAPAQETVTYTVGDKNVATYADGTLTAAGAGKTTLTASFTADGKTLTATADVTVLGSSSAEKVNALEDINLFGRTYLSKNKLALGNVCTGVELAFYGTELTCKFSSLNGRVRYFVDGDEEGTFAKTAFSMPIGGLAEGVHTVRILKASAPTGEILFDAEPFSTDGIFLVPPPKPDFKIEFIGDSITQGCGNLGSAGEPSATPDNSDATKTYAYLTARQLGADFSIVARDGMCIKDPPVCGYDSYLTVSVNSSIPYEGPFDADVVVLALAENDMWHATFPNYSLEQLAEDYKAMLARIREKNPEALIVCVYGMMPASSTYQAKSLIEGAIADMGDSKISSVFMISNEAGANKHPNLQANSSNAKKLIKHIQGLLGEGGAQ